MRAGQQGPQLMTRVFLNHDLVTDCIHKGMCSFSTLCWSAFSLWGRQAALGGLLYAIPDGFVQRPVPDSLVQEAVKMVTSPSHSLTQHTFIALCSSSTSSVSAGVSDLCVWQTRRYQHTHTLSLSVTVCMQRGLCAYECV